MKTQIVPFAFEGKNIRVIAGSNGEPLFVGKDICDALGYINHNDAIKAHCKGVAKHYPLQTAGGLQKVRVLEEGDMFRLVVNSTLPSAEAFERLVFDEILPTIRKTGSYSSSQPTRARQADAPERLFPGYYKIARLIGCDQNTAAISANNAVFQKTGENVLQLLGQQHLETPDQQLYFNVSDLVESISGRRMNKILCEAGLQDKDGDRWIPTAAGEKHSRIYDTGKRHSTGMPVQSVRWSRDVLKLISLDQAA